ncbi:MAG: tetratricopeptide repeat protein [Ignavibacteriota bacterium]
MSRWIPGLLLAGMLPLAAQEQTTPQTRRPSRNSISGRRPRRRANRRCRPRKTSPFSAKSTPSIPLQSQKSVEVGDHYFRNGKLQGAAYRYQDATLWNDGNAEAWLKLAKVEEKLKDEKAAKDAYSKYLAPFPDAKDAASVRKKLQSMK